jgi:hypothetical protein
LEYVFAGAFVLAWLATLVAWVAIVVYGLKVIRNVLPGVSLWGRQTAYNPANVVFHPELLTPEGQACRRRLGYALAVFVALVLGTLLLAGLTGNLRA